MGIRSRILLFQLIVVGAVVMMAAIVYITIRSTTYYTQRVHLANNQLETLYPRTRDRSFLPGTRRIPAVRKRHREQPSYSCREPASPNYQRLEYQANVFSSALILPELHFLFKIGEFRREHDIRYRGHGFVFVDDQTQNLNEYHGLLGSLSTHFAVSKEVIEIRLKNLKMLTDKRTRQQPTFASDLLKSLTKFGRVE
jgi:hypothetical protein